MAEGCPSHVICETCGRSFSGRDEMIQRMVFSGQVVSKGKRRQIEELHSCGHLREECSSHV